MASASDRSGDIVFHLGINTSMGQFMDVDYNVSEFLRFRDFDESSRNLVDAMDKFTHLLDAKVHIDSSDSKYLHIYQGIETVVKRVLEELIKLDPYFAKVKLRRTGSSMSGVKVGFPHETDYLLELPKDDKLKTGKSFKDGTLILVVRQIVKEQATSLTQGLGHWIIHGQVEHSKTGGVCLVMECSSSADGSASEVVGVTVDLVPVYIMETTSEELKEKAEVYLSNTLEGYAQRGELYKLLNSSLSDTGFIENMMMKQLPEDKKRAFRVVKFLIATASVKPLIPFSCIQSLDQETLLRLYGRKPCIPSFDLRILLLHLLLHIHGTAAEPKLKDGLLVLCLLDMLQQCVDYTKTIYMIFDHPIINERGDHFCNTEYSKKAIDSIISRLERENPGDVAEEFKLLNDTSKVYSDKNDDLFW